MSERLRHLQRQQALLREHLAWIESEIARESGQPETTTNAPEEKQPPSAPMAMSLSDADALLNRYSAEEHQNPADIRRGCLIIFTSALLLFVGGVTVIWLMYYR